MCTPLDILLRFVCIAALDMLSMVRLRARTWSHCRTMTVKLRRDFPSFSGRRVVFSFPCGGWSALLCIQPGPPVLFSKQFPLGVEDASGEVLGAALAARNVIDKGLLILTAAVQSGSELLGESPPSRGRGSPFAFKEKIYSDHVCQWDYPPMAAFLEKHEMVAIYADQGAAGAKRVKTSEMRVTKGLRSAAELLLGTLVDRRSLKPRGADSADYSDGQHRMVTKILGGTRIVPLTHLSSRAVLLLLSSPASCLMERKVRLQCLLPLHLL